MSLIKTPEEIEKLKRGGAILSRTLRMAMDACVAGASTEALDRIARDEFAKAGGKPSFLGYRISPNDPPYPSALCISINEEVVHGLSTPDRMIKDGDIVGLDIGMWYEGLATDMAATVMVGNERSARVLEKLGFVREGTLRSYKNVRGEMKDYWIFGRVETAAG